MASGASRPRILLVDIETFPDLAHVWNLYEANALDVVKHWIICGFSAKWLGGEQVTKILPDYRGAQKRGEWDDKKLVRDLWGLMCQADIVVGQNGDRFDIRKINARLARHGLTPPPPFQTVDTLKISRRIFGFSSNKLDFVCQYLQLGGKFHTGGYSLWKGCMRNDEKSWKQMRRYNAQDVRLLERLYLRLLPWINNHPNMGIFTDGEACPKCGSKKLQSRGPAYKRGAEYRRFQCRSCGGWCRSAASTRRVTVTHA